MSLKIVERSAGSVTILEFYGRITLGEGASSLRDTLRDVVSRGRKKIILSLAEVAYVDSSGIGELVGGYTTVTNAGGSLVILRFSGRVKRLLQSIQLYSVFEVFEDEVSALKYLEVSPLHCLCPICGSRSSPALLDGPDWPPQTCGGSGCGAQFTLADGLTQSAAHLIAHARIPTYTDEFFEVVTGKPFHVRIVGRLNLFTSSSLNKLWNALPARIVLFDLHLASEVTGEGRDALLRLAANPGKDGNAAISIEGLAPEHAAGFDTLPPVYSTKAQALTAIGDLARKTPDWPASFHSPVQA